RRGSVAGRTGSDPDPLGSPRGRGAGGSGAARGRDQQGGDLESREVRGGGTECDAGLPSVRSRHFPLVADESGYHEPVMVREVLEHLQPKLGGFYYDGTVGGGGHTEAILREGGAAGVIGVDQVVEALRVAGARLEPYEGRVELVNANFADAAE